MTTLITLLVLLLPFAGVAVLIALAIMIIGRETPPKK